MYSSPAWIVLTLCSCVFTLSVAVIDYRFHRIPNKLTLPMFAAGWVYQLAFFQLSGLVDGLTGFAIGFGMFFLLWISGGGGGGDVKLVGAISVWLGFYKTLWLIVVSTFIVILGTGLLMLYGMITKGVYRTKRDFLPGKDEVKKKKGPTDLLKFNRNRTGMTYGLSVAIATVIVTLLTPPGEAYWKHREELRAEKAAQAEKLLKEKEGGSETEDSKEPVEKPGSDSK